MKINQLCLMFCFSLAFAAAQAQPSKGSMLIGGNAGFTSTSSGEFNSTVISISPLVGFFATERVAVGGQLTMNFYGGDSDGSLIGIGPGVRYYFNDSGASRFFGQGNFSWQTLNPGGDSDSQSGVGFGLGVGLDYFLNQYVALEVIMAYNNFKYSDAADGINTFGLAVGVAAFIGGDGK